MSTPNPSAAAFLGLDAGGTQTRWAVTDAAGAVLHDGAVAGISGLQLHDESGRAAVAAALRELAAAAGPVQAVVAGVSGFDATQATQLCGLLAAALGTAVTDVRALSDIELACRAAHAPGQGYVVYAGTGSGAGFIDAQGVLQRAGGRGALIDDAGGGHWIACQALRQIWRAEDRAPCSWPASALARRLFEQMGGSSWTHVRGWVYGATRGGLGKLALAVAAAATDEDAAALAILHQAGHELARLAQALLQRHGPRPLALAGRVFQLHPAIEAALRQALPPATPIRQLTAPAHVEAARMAARAVRA